MKKIDLDTLQNVERKASLSKLRRGGMTLGLIILLAGGGYAAYRMVTGEVVESRFTVNKMNCPACIITVKEVTGKVPGVLNTDVSLASQNVIVTFRDKQTDTNKISRAIAHAGYPVKLDGMFKATGEGIGEPVAAYVNGKPVFSKDLKTSLDVGASESKNRNETSAFFSVIGKEILLQAADKESVVVQPFEVEQEVQKIFKDRGATREEFTAWINSAYGSAEKYYQAVGQRLGIRRLFDDHVLANVKDPEARKHKALERAGTLFKDADVKILDPALKEKIRASAGKDDWKILWPRLIGSDTELKRLFAECVGADDTNKPNSSGKEAVSQEEQQKTVGKEQTK